MSGPPEPPPGGEPVPEPGEAELLESYRRMVARAAARMAAADLEGREPDLCPEPRP